VVKLFSIDYIKYLGTLHLLLCKWLEFLYLVTLNTQFFIFAFSLKTGSCRQHCSKKLSQTKKQTKDGANRKRETPFLATLDQSWEW
jgi:hypothetical protein